MSLPTVKTGVRGDLTPPVTPAPEAVPQAVDESAIDSSMFDEFRGEGSGGKEFVIALINQYLAESTALMASLKEAAARRDAPAVRVAAHSLKGASSTVGAIRMAGICGSLEDLARPAAFDGEPALVAALEDEFTRVRHALQVEQGVAE